MRTDIDDALERINLKLPEDIRVVSIKKATKGFDAQHNCSYRTYEYLTPTFAFTPVDQVPWNS